MTVAGKIDAHQWERAPGEWYSEGPSAADALFQVETFVGSIVDPCCGMGNIVRAAWNLGLPAQGYDIVDRPEYRARFHHPENGTQTINYGPTDLFDASAWGQVDNIAFNPPYADGPDGRRGPRLEQLAIDRALEISRGKVAALLELKWMVPRIAWLRSRGLLRIWVLTPRLSILPGEVVKRGEMPGGGSKDYAWYVFRKGADVLPTIGEARRDPLIDKPDRWTWRPGVEARPHDPS